MNRPIKQQFTKASSASRNPSCFSKVLGGWNLQSHETSYLTTPPPPPRLAGSQAVWPWLNPDTVVMSPPAANSAASASSAALCFHAKLPAKLAFIPYPWASSKRTETEKMDGRPDVCMYFSSRSALEAEPKGCQALKNRFDCLSSVDGSEVASFGGIKIKGARGAWSENNLADHGDFIGI